MRIIWTLALLFMANGALAESGSLFRDARAEPGTRGAVSGASLFAGRADAGLFAPRAPRPPPVPSVPASLATAPPLPQSTTPVARLRDLIAVAEAGPDQYDAYNHGARVPPPRPPTQMRIKDIYAWIAATPGQPHAIGRYQFIPNTLRGLVRKLGIDEDAMFSPELQNRLADQLLREAGLQQFLSGELGRTAFMNRLARIWAGLPTSSGRSHYHGYAGNRATMTWADFETGMARIFPGLGV